MYDQAEVASFLWVSQPKLYASLLCPLGDTCFACLILLDFITQILFDLETNLFLHNLHKRQYQTTTCFLCVIK